MNKCVGHIALPKDEAVAGLLDKCVFHPTVETVPLEEALDRIAAADMAAIHTLPNMISSRMDGIAVHWADFESGMPDTSSWQEGREYVFCNCGIGIAGDYDTIIRIEDVDLEGGRLVIHAAPREKGQWVTPPGALVKEGELLVRQGDRLSPLLISKLATGGYGDAAVYRQPVVAFIPTGSELVPAGQPVPPGKNVDSNSLMARAKIRQWGGVPRIYPVTEDRPEAICQALRDALEASDIVLINAGSSQGRKDYTIECLEQMGTILSHIIMRGPGAHTSCTVSFEGKPIVGIPGPAVGAECTIDWFLLPLMEAYYGRPTDVPRVKAVFAGEEIPYTAPSNGWARVQRAVIERSADSTLTIRPVEFHDVAMMDRSNAFIRVTSEGLKPGQEVEAELRYPYRGF